jgi:hypothetical protein
MLQMMNKKHTPPNSPFYFIFWVGGLTKIQVNLNGEQEDANETKVEEGMDENGCPAGLKVAKLHAAVAPGHLEKQTWS